MRIIATLLLAVAPGFSAQLERSLPLFFFPNTGQTDPSVQYIVQTPDLSARFLADSVIFHVQENQLAVHFPGANSGAFVEGQQRLEAKLNFFLGNTRDDWKKDVPAYSKIVYRELYPGIDMSYGGTARRVKSEFLVSPGADPQLIRLQYSEPVAIDANGNLMVGGFQEDAPEIYQQRGKTRMIIAGRYRMLDAYTVGFEIGVYDNSAPLVIDPTISYCTYLGGSGLTSITGVAVDSAANLYMTGWTEALNFPIVGPVQASNQGGVDILVAKLNPAGTAIAYATYIGGKSDDKGAAIAVDSLGHAYVTGSTASSNFPLVLSIRPSLGGSTTAFALKLNATGNTLLYSGYLGGTNYDLGTSIAVDSNSNAYIGGDTQSTNFPLYNPTQPVFAGGTEAFITRLNSTGAITFSTFLGGSGNEHVGGIAVDVLGDIFVAGGTSSTNFPTVSPYQAAIKGTQDAFLTRISFNGSVAFSTYFGGSGGAPEQANAIALDSSGNPYITGVTSSTNFPVTAGAFQTALPGVQNAFVAKFNSTGSALSYSSYLGGSSYDWGTGIAVSAAGNAYVTGYTASVNFPPANPIQASFGGLYDAFVSELNFTGNGLIFSSYYGGSGSDASNAIALDVNANIFLGGQTSSVDLHLVSPIQSTIATASTGWIMRLGVSAAPPTTPAALSVSPSRQDSGSSVTFTAQYSDTGGALNITSAALLVNASASTGVACYVSYNPGLNLFSIYNDAGTAVLSTVTPGGAPAQNTQCALNGVGSSASVSGNNLTVNFSLTFQPPFPGPKTVYLSVADPGSNTGLIAVGTYTASIAPGTPQVTSVSPNNASGTGATFNFVYSDTVFAANLTSVSVLFNSSLTFNNACSIAYSLTNNTVSLTTDNGLSSTSVPLGSATVLQNSQCVVSATASQQSGLSIIFTASVNFKGAFNGTQTIFMNAAVGSLTSGWVNEGTFAATNGGQPMVVGSVPNTGSGPQERFTFTIADPGGASYLTYGAILFASTFNTLNACYLQWDAIRGSLGVTYDNPAQGITAYPPGTNVIATSSQCGMNILNSTIIRGATQVLITLDLTFNSSFSGPKNIYMYAAEPTSNSGWSTVGTWTVTGGIAAPISMTPSSGAGSLLEFAFMVTDSTSQTNVQGISVLFTTGAPNNIANACYVVYNRPAITVGLWDDTGNTTLKLPKGIGSSALMQNSHCGIQHTGYQVVGSQFQFTVQILFNTATFSGPKSVYVNVTEPLSSSGFILMGNWTVQ